MPVSEIIRKNVENMTEDRRKTLCNKCNALYEGNEPKNCSVFCVYGVCKYLTIDEIGIVTYF